MRTSVLNRWADPDGGLLGLRLWLGVVGVLHGAQKFGAFGGDGIQGFAGFLNKLNVPMPGVSAVVAALSELLGGLLIALGIVPRLAAVPFAITMMVAFATAHQGKFFAQTGGGEYPLTLAVMAAVVMVAGPGRYTVMRLSGGRAPLAARPAMR